ncbi:transposase [Kitasatospora sp. NRRL B-11411]|uniref:transposase n=1 Tax=Kitasatospora sp. NRRL B-11411 TaxID=1463822 RepID=UPI0021010774|nr:transposase [Kitasatospora sp. NRRL B-11411]
MDPHRPCRAGPTASWDWEVLAAIVFVATSGCTWRQLPPIVGACWQTVYRHFTGHGYGRLLQFDPSCPF